MAIREVILVLFLVGVCVYAWKDWYVALCALIFLTALLENHNIPKSIMHIQGLNPWTILFLVTLVPYLIERFKAGPRWDVPSLAIFIVVAYMAVIVIAVCRLLMDLESLPVGGGDSAARWRAYHQPSIVISDFMINPIKFMLPAILLYDGCRTRRRMLLALGTLFLTGVVLAVLVIKVTPLGVLTGSFHPLDFRNRINNQIGLHANSAALYLGGLLWGMLASTRGRWLGKYRIPMLGASGVVLIVFLICFSRTGYASFLLTGFFFGVLYWRALLFLIPIGTFASAVAFPNVIERLATGFDFSGTGAAADVDTITAGRTGYLWPAALKQIADEPFIGLGRLGLLRSTAYDEIYAIQGEVPIHPHCTYLEVLLDSGVIGLAVVLAMMGGVLWITISLARLRNQPLFSTVGATGLAMALAAMVGGAGGRFFMIPSHYLMMIWCTWALALRAWVVSRQWPAARGRR
jgi:O-antigen ligase